MSLMSPIFSLLLPMTSTPFRFDTSIWLGDCDARVEAEALGLLVLALGLAALVPLGFDASDFIASEEEDPEGKAGEEADGVVEAGLELDGEDDCAMADDSINPLSAVESNSFCNIGETSMHRGSFVVMASGPVFRSRFAFAAWKNRPS